MKRPFLAAVAALTLAAGCRPDRPKLPDLPQAFSTVPIPPRAEFVGRSGSNDALMLTFRSELAPDSVAEYYRQLFRRDTTYHVVADTKGGVGETALYVEAGDRPLWIRIRPTAEGIGAVVELTGAVTAPADTARNAARTRPAN
jgi:hypothetical protein